MQTNITLQTINGAEDKINETKVQFIPAKMELTSSGKAPIEAYFNQYTEERDGDLTNALRGYPLNGRKFKTPDGFLGIVYEDAKAKISDTNRTLKVNCVFNEYTYWNYDKIPSDNDALIKALDWIDISNSFQQQADADKLAEFIENQKLNAPTKPKSEDDENGDAE